MAKRVICLLSRMGGPFQTEDQSAASAITPGMLIAPNGSNLWAAHATAGGNTVKAVALERDEMGKDIDQPYAAGDAVKAWFVAPGERVNALIATGQNIAINAIMESAGNGTLRVLAAGTPLFKALEAVDNSASGVNARIKVVAL
jgi:hypothetical protein